MQFDVTYVENADYVCGTLKGEVTDADLASARSEMRSKLLDHDCKRLLVDTVGLSQLQSIISDFEFTTEHQTELPTGTRHAVVVNPKHTEHMQFVENVAQNRSINLKIFTERNEAIDWLLSY